MSYLKTTLCLTIAGGLTACTAASQKTAEVKPQIAEAQRHSQDVQVASKATAHLATVKPGASVAMTSTLPKLMTSGSFQSVQLKFEEAYNNGSMTVTVAPSEGLSLFGGASSKTFDMANLDAHTWDIDVKADVDGVYFLNIFADAQGQSRTFSVRLNMGEVTQKMFDDAMPNIGELTDGGKIRVLEAEETIQ